MNIWLLLRRKVSKISGEQSGLLNCILIICIIIHMLEHLILNGRFESAYQYYQISPRNFKEQLVTHFNKGKRKDFMRLFTLLRTEEKLEFYIRVYFLIYNIHPSLKPKGSIPQEQIVAFRQFLQTKGADLAKTNEFLQFYALSYVKKPLEHPSYKSLFKKEWVNNLSEKLAFFLQQQEKRMKDCAILGDFDQRRSPQFQSSQAILNNNLKELEAKNKNLFDEVQAFKRKYHELQRNNQSLIESFNSHLMQSQNKWFQITRQLTNNAKVLVDLIGRTNSNLIHDRRYQRIKKRTQKFQKIVKKQLDQLLNQSQDISVFDKPSANQISYSAVSVTPNVSQRNLTTFVTLDEFIPTNYIALIRDFKKMADTQKISVLQGLSWRIIKSKNKQVRRQTIIGLVVNDVLGLVNGDIQLLMFNPALTYNVLQIFLFISQDSYGRRVLFRNGGLYKQVIDLIPQTMKSNNLQCLDLILQILLNIWHNKDIFVELINLNIVDICVNLLQKPEITTNQQILQSITTILLNATATQEGLSSFQYQINIFYYLSEAFRQSNDSNRNLIGAIMYALLGRKNLWKLAHQAKLPTFINDMIEEDRRSNKQQLKIIQSKLHSFQPGKTMDPTQLDDQKSIDSELEQQNFMRNEDELQDLQQYIKGHEMLAAKYALRNKQADKQIEEINKIMNANEKKAQVQQNVPKDNKNQQIAKGLSNPQKQKLVHLPQIKKKKESLEIYNPKNKSKIQQSKQYYSYKSPNFKQNQQKSVVSAQVEKIEFIQDSQKPKVHSFEHESTELKRVNRVFTKPSQPSNQISNKKEAQDRKSAQKPQYRIKKSSSVQKVTNPYRKQTLPYEANKNSSNVADYKSIQGIKSPPQKKSREEVLKQLNQQLRAEKKNQEQEKKLSIKNAPVNIQGNIQRENTHLRKNNFVAIQQDVKAFQSKPKLRRTPPQDQK